jgi:gas vesicle protein
MSNQRSGVFVGGLLIGSAIGALTGILIAPRTGRETRRLLQESAEALPELAEELTETLQKQADRLSEVTLRNWEGTLERLGEAIAAGLEASRMEAQRFNPGTGNSNGSSGDRLTEAQASQQSHP